MSDLFGLSDAAKQAVSWLYSEQARNLSVMEARAAILEGFGVAVDEELRSIFSKRDAGDGDLTQLKASESNWSFFMNIKCNKCGHIGPESEFPEGRDFFQNQYIAGCPKCDNRQSPGGASMRMFDDKRPFERSEETTPITVTDKQSAINETLRRANSVS